MHLFVLIVKYPGCLGQIEYTFWLCGPVSLTSVALAVHYHRALGKPWEVRATTPVLSEEKHR